jgi:hypothetical protein
MSKMPVVAKYNLSVDQPQQSQDLELLLIFNSIITVQTDKISPERNKANLPHTAPGSTAGRQASYDCSNKKKSSSAHGVCY